MKYKIIISVLAAVLIVGCNSERTVVTECELTQEEMEFYDATQKFIAESPMFEKDPVKLIIVDRTNGRIFIAVQTVSGVRHGFGTGN